MGDRRSPGVRALRDAGCDAWRLTGNGGTYQTQDARSYYGCYSMTGNVREWCYDWYDSSYYSSSPYDNPTGAPAGTDRVVRDGMWFSFPVFCRSASRSANLPERREHYHGFRCAAGT